jgi:hypothetical protein
VEGLSELADFTLLARQWTGCLIREGRAHDRVSALAAMRADEARALGEAYLARVARLRQTDRPLFVDKAPGNLLNLPLIRLALPGARIIHVRRDPMACAFRFIPRISPPGRATAMILSRWAAIVAARRSWPRTCMRPCPKR